MKAQFTKIFICMLFPLLSYAQDSLKTSMLPYNTITPAEPQWRVDDPGRVIAPVSYSEADAAGRCDGIDTLQCGGFVQGNTTNATSLFAKADYSCISTTDVFDGPDHAYKVVVNTKSSIQFVLEMQIGIDLDLILLKTCATGAGSVCVGASIEGNTATGVNKEILDLNLDPGTYLLIIDGWKADQKGQYKVSMSCTCTCIEPLDDMPTGDKVHCDDFRNYNLNKLAVQSSRWQLFAPFIVVNNQAVSNPNNLDGNVLLDGSNKYARINDGSTSASVAADVVYRIGNGDATTGRYRASWRMRVAASRGGYFNLMHQLPNAFGNGFSLAYEAFFNTNGTGNLIYYTNTGLKTEIPFFYPTNQWYNVVNIIDLDTDIAELWINDVFVGSWKFSYASGPATGNGPFKKLAAIDFWATTTPTGTIQDYCIDDLCIWKSIPNCNGQGTDKVCIENNTKSSEASARCKLYTSDEWEDCLTVCDYGGTFINRGINYTGKLDSSDEAPGFIRRDPCVKSAYGGNIPSKLYADVFVFNKQDKIAMNASFVGTPPPGHKLFVFACNTRPVGNTCVYGQQCLTDIGNYYSPLTCDSIYYIVITGPPSPANGYQFNIIPNGPCGSGFTDIKTPCEDNFVTETRVFPGQTTNTTNLLNKTNSYFTKYAGPRAYNGNERIYRLPLRNQAQVEFTLVEKSGRKMGLFLFNNLCGVNMDFFREKAATGDTIRFTRFLQPNDYYLVVDSDNSGNSTFDLIIKCLGTVKSLYFINENVDACGSFTGNDPIVKKGFIGDGEYCGCKGTNLISKHTIDFELGSSGLKLSANDRIQFLIRDSLTGDFDGTSHLSEYIVKSPIRSMTLNEDDPADSTQCSYMKGDTFYVRIYNKDSGNQGWKFVRPDYQDVSPQGDPNARDTFKMAGKSIITRLNLFDSISNVVFTAEEPGLFPRPDVENTSFYFKANQKWKTQITSESNWPISLNTSETNNEDGSGANSRTLTVSFTTNPDPKPRKAIIKFISKTRPKLIYHYMPVVQQANCNFTPTATVSLSRSGVCRGDTLKLTATVRDQANKDISDAFSYKWNNGRTDRVFLDTAKTGSSKLYTVTATSRYCIDIAPAIANKTLNINNLPNNPTKNANTDASICPNTKPTLTAQNNDNASLVDIEWYRDTFATQFIGVGSSIPGPDVLTVPGAYKYYYRAVYKSGTPRCASQTFPAKITVRNPPVIAVINKQCEPSLLSYRFDGTTSAGSSVSVLTGSGTVSTVVNGNFSITGIPKNTNISFRVTDANGCTATENVVGLACECPTPPAPTPNAVTPVCEGSPLPLLSVTVDQSKYTVNWYESPTGGSKKASNTLSFQPTELKPYYAETQDKLATQCVSASRTEMIIPIKPRPGLQIQSVTCDDDRDHYTIQIKTEPGVGITRTPAIGVLNALGNGNFTLATVPEGSNVKITATNPANSCSRDSLVVSPECGCPFIPLPGGPTQRTICEKDFLEPLQVTVGANETADWFKANGDTLLINSTVLNISTGGDYYVQARNTKSNCSSERKKITVTINPRPQISLSAPQCAPDLLSWSLEFSVPDGGTPSQPLPGGNLFTGANNTYSITSIPSGQTVRFFVTNPATNCKRDTTVKAPVCTCASLPPLAAPVFVKNEVYCQNDTIPTLYVNVQPGETGDWYNAQNELVHSGAEYEDAPKGTYRVFRRNLTNNCVSAGFVTVTLTENPLPSLEVTDSKCAANLLTWEISLNSNADDITPSAGVKSGSKPSFKVTGIPKDQNVEISARNASTGCVNKQTFEAKKCDCEALGVISAPSINQANPLSICSDEALPVLIVTVKSGETAIWYDSLGKVLALDTLRYMPEAAGLFFVEAKNKANGCKSNTRLSFRLRINPIPVFSIADTVCNAALDKYNLKIKSSIPPTISPNFTRINNGDGTFSFVNVPLGQLVKVNVRVVSTGCDTELPYQKNECACPSLPAPGNPIGATICKGAAIPSLEVSVSDPGTQTVDWFDAESGGNFLDEGLSYKPLTANTRTYWAQTRYTPNSNCISASRTPVTLTVNEPVVVNAGLDQEVCDGEPVFLKATVSGGISTGTWKAVSGTFENAKSLETKYIPQKGISSITLTFTSDKPAGPCPAVSDNVNIKIRKNPVLQPSTNVCSKDKLSYTATFTTDADSLKLNAGKLKFLGGTEWEVSNIPKDSNLVIVAMDRTIKCPATFTIATTGCPCSLLNAPTEPNNPTICPEAPKPLLTVKVPVGQTVDWYDKQIGGTRLLANSLSYPPSIAGVVFAEAVDIDAKQCVSVGRTPVSLNFKPTPAANAGLNKSVCPGKETTLNAEGLADTYLWSNGATTSGTTVSPETDRFYYLTITVDGCKGTDSVFVDVLNAVDAKIETVSEIKCFGEKGEIRVVASGGQGGFKPPLWNTGENTPKVTKESGIYSVLVTDEAGCTDTAIYFLPQPEKIILLDSIVKPETGTLGNGSIVANFSGGVKPYTYQWYTSGFQIPNQTNNFILNRDTGEYVIRVKDKNNCIFEQKFRIRRIVSVREPEWAQHIKLYPNPTTGILTVQMDMPDYQEIRLDCFDAQGRLVSVEKSASAHPNSHAYDLSHLPAGLYLFRFGLGHEVLTRTVAVQK